MKRKLWTLLLALGAALALCAGASAETVENDFYAALQATNGSIKLENDFVYEKAMEVNYDLTIDLNGYVLTIPKSICVNSGAHLTIKDSNPNATHKFTPNVDGLWVLNKTNGTETVTGDSVEGFPVRGWSINPYFATNVERQPFNHGLLKSNNRVWCSISTSCQR